MTNKTKGLIVALTIGVVVLLAATVSTLDRQYVPDATTMSQEWANDFIAVEPGQIMRQYSIPESALYEALTQWQAEGFNAIHVYIKADWNTNEITLGLKLPDGTFLEQIPICPPYCPDNEEKNS